MTGKEATKTIMKDRGYTYKTLADKLGYAHHSSVSERLKEASADMRVDTLVKMLEAMDCELVVRSKLKDKKEWRIG